MINARCNREQYQYDGLLEKSQYAEDDLLIFWNKEGNPVEKA